MFLFLFFCLFSFRYVRKDQSFYSLWNKHMAVILQVREHEEGKKGEKAYDP